MRQMADKVNGDTVQDYEWNPAQDELQNAVTDSGQTLNASDNFQLSKSMSIYAGSGDYYLDSGSANAYILSPIGAKQAPYDYIDGLRVKFVPANSNNAASTISISGLSSIPLKKGQLTALTDVVIGDLVTGYLSEAIYYVGLGYFVLLPSSYTQIVNIINTIQFPTGFVSQAIGQPNSFPGWVIMDDGTIGDASSGASTRANADCQKLFIQLYNNCADTNAPVSGGRTGNALNDWNAHKRIQLLKSKSTYMYNGYGTYALGYKLGSATAGLIVGNMPAHSHTIHSPNAGITAGSTGITVAQATAGTNTLITADSAGGGAAFTILPLGMSLNWFMKL